MSQVEPRGDEYSNIIDHLVDHERKLLLEQCHRQKFSKGQTVFSKGDDGGWLLLIQEGMVEVSLLSLSGRKSVLNIMEPGDLLGEISLLDRRPRSADAIARTEVYGLVLHSHTMNTFLKNNPDACLSIIETLCQRVRNASDMFETVSLTNAGARLARCLLLFGNKWGKPNPDGSISLQHSLTQLELGELSGIARENVNRYLRLWSEDEIVQFNRGEVTLLNVSKLQQIAEL